MKNQLLANWYVNILILTAYTIPLSRKIVVILLAIGIVCSLSVKGWLSSFKKNFSNPVIKLFLLFFLIQLVGYFFINNKKGFAFEIETKLSFLLMPVLFRTDIIKLNQLAQLKIAFIQGCIIAVILNLLNSVYRYYYSGDISSFLYGQFSFNIHSSYFAQYLLLSIAFILSSKKMRALPVWWLGLALLLLGVVLCLSRAGLISLMILLLLFAAYTVREKGNKKAFLFILLIFTALVTPLLLTGNFTERLKQAFKTKKDLNTSIEAATAYERIELWKSAASIIAENIWFGVGSADVKNELLNEYKKRNLYFAEQYRLNCHNQYLQTLLANGILGLLVLLLILIYMFYNAFIFNDLSLMAFVLITAVGFMFESVLETQAGIVFFAFFTLYFAIKNKISLTPDKTKDFIMLSS